MLCDCHCTFRNVVSSTDSFLLNYVICCDSNITEQYFAHLHMYTLNYGYNYWDVSILKQLAELWYQQKWVVRLYLFFHHIQCSTGSYVHWKYGHIMKAVVQMRIVDIAPDMGWLISNGQSTLIVVEVAGVLTNQMRNCVDFHTQITSLSAYWTDLCYLSWSYELYFNTYCGNTFVQKP